MSGKKSNMAELLAIKVEEVKDCMAHALNWTVFNSARRYRRGKNRCYRCGYYKTPFYYQHSKKEGQ